MGIQEEIQVVNAAIDAHQAEFGPVFGLRSFPGQAFRINKMLSHVNDGGIIIWTDVFETNKWARFVEASVDELKVQSIRLSDTREKVSEGEGLAGCSAGVSESPTGEKGQGNSEISENALVEERTSMTMEEKHMSNSETNNTLSGANKEKEAKQMAKNTKNTQEKAPEAPKDSEQTSKSSDVVTLTKGELKDIVETCVAAAVGAAKPAKATKSAKSTKKGPSKRAANRAKARADRREANRSRSAEALAAAVEASGKSEEEVKVAFRAAHDYARQDQGSYKERYNQKLQELIGCQRYAA